jgi:baseplate J-like protein
VATPISLLYLDVDDEITSAANRIRNVTEMRVALVLPAGSRLATSRMNFRLLAREAQAHAHDLFIVAPEAATRALAASAGLAVYQTVHELEEAMDPEGTTGAVAPGASAVTIPLDRVAPPDRAGKPHGDMARHLDAKVETPTEPFVEPIPGSRVAADRPYGVPAGRSAGSGSLPVVSGSRRRAERRNGWVVALVAILVVAAIGGFIGGQLLPAATIVVTPKVEPVSLSFDVTADPKVTAPDPRATVVPATRPTFPLEATDDFQATGRKITETRATGIVRFTSFDTSSDTDIPAGSIVSTPNGIQFATQANVHLPVAPPLDSVFADVAVTARKPGTAGNVSAARITVIEDYPKPVPGILKVTNRAATSGGTHTEKVIVSQKDIDKALAALTSQIDAQLGVIVTEPGQILPDLTVFPDTKSRTTAVPAPDPKTLLNDQVESFSLSMTATGTITAVDESAVSTLATVRLRAAIPSDHDLVKDSASVTVGAGAAQGDVIVFPVQATAQQVRRVVAADLVAAVKGKSLADARATLETYGTTTIDLWPVFASSVPNYDFRINLTVRTGVPIETASPPPASSAPASGRPSSGGSPSSAPIGSPRASPRPSATAAP